MPEPLFTQLFSLAGKKAIITGASAGIGRQIAISLAAAGASVVIAARNQQAASEVVKQITDSGGYALTLPVQIDSESSIVQMMQLAQTTLGQIDILVNNAGVFPMTPILETSADEWDAVHNTNLRGTFICLREAAKHMQNTNTGGRIINISSIGSLRSSVSGRSAYDTSKAAVNRLTAEAALEFAPLNILVNAILPGPIATEKLEAMGEKGKILEQQVSRQIPLGHWGSPLDIAAAVIYLSSPAGRFITGQTLVVDGGAVLI